MAKDSKVDLRECRFEKFDGTPKVARDLAKRQKPEKFSRDPYIQLENYYSSVGNELEAKRFHLQGRSEQRRNAFSREKDKATQWPLPTKLLAPNATRALKELDLTNALQAIGSPVRVGEIRSWRGELLSRLPVWQLSEKMGAQTAAVHRADLQGLLLRELGNGAVRLRAACIGFEQGEEGARAYFADGTEKEVGRGRMWLLECVFYEKTEPG